MRPGTEEGGKAHGGDYTAQLMVVEEEEDNLVGQAWVRREPLRGVHMMPQALVPSEVIKRKKSTTLLSKALRCILRP